MADVMLEAPVEKRLKRLERYGFLVLKLRTPGYNGVPDRMILRPKYAPGPPAVVEIKRPGATPRLLQAKVADEWRARGVDVLPYCDTYEKVDALIWNLIASLVCTRCGAQNDNGGCRVLQPEFIPEHCPLAEAGK